MRDTVANFAQTTLAANLGLSDATISLTSGATFPASNFLVQIDSELILVSSLSGNTATVGARGQEGTTVATHTSGAQVAQPFTAGMLAHLWDRLPDRLTIATPPIARGSTPASADEEFTSDAGTWTLAGSDGYARWDMGKTRSSYFSLTSAAPSAQYLLYKAWTPTQTSWSLTGALSLGANVGALGSAQVALWLSDTAPSGTQLQGNVFQLGWSTQTAELTNSTFAGFPSEVLTATLRLQDGTPLQQASSLRLPYRWLKLSFDGSTLSATAGTEQTVQTLLQWPTTSLLPHYLGLLCQCQHAPNRSTTFACDYLRVTGS